MLKRTRYVKRAKTSSTVEICDGAKKEIEYQYLDDIVSALEKWNILSDLVVNFHQSPSKLTLVGRCLAQTLQFLVHLIKKPSLQVLLFLY